MKENTWQNTASCDYEIQHQLDKMTKMYCELLSKYNQLNRDYHNLLSLHQEQDKKFFERIQGEYDDK